VGIGVSLDCSVGVLVRLEPGAADVPDPPLGLGVGASPQAGDVGLAVVAGAVVAVAAGDALAVGAASSRRGDGTGRGRGPGEPTGPTGVMV
jgi:hypothetical protein